MEGFMLPEMTGDATAPISQSVFLSVVEKRKLGMSKDSMISVNEKKEGQRHGPAR